MLWPAAQVAGSPGTGWDLPQLGIRGLQSVLKLRTCHRFSDRLSADLGVDISAFTQAIIPRAALSYKVRRRAFHILYTASLCLWYLDRP